MPTFRRSNAFEETVQTVVSAMVTPATTVRVIDDILWVGDSTIGLTDLRAHWDRLGADERDAWLHTAVPTLLAPPAVPDRLSTTRPLRPGLRHRSVVEKARLDHFFDELHQNSPTGPLIPHRPFGGEITTVLLWDHPTSMSVLNEHHFEGWGARFDDLLAVAVDNLADQPATGWSSRDGRVWVSGRGDDYGGSRLVDPDFLAETGIQGDAVIVHPHRHLVVAAAVDDAIGIQMACQLAMDETEAPSPISFRPLVGRPNNWKLLNLSDSHPAAELTRRLGQLDRSLHYGQLRPSLQALVSDDLLLGDYLIHRDQGGRWVTSTVWHESTPSLLPRTDVVQLVTDQAEMLTIPWGQLHQLLGPSMEQTKYYPELWRVERFPDESARRQLRSHLDG